MCRCGLRCVLFVSSDLELGLMWAEQQGQRNGVYVELAGLPAGGNTTLLSN